ncbi:MAG: NAD(+)/NADH kinase [Acidobacteria bacterium]|nr:NAD(+)/NADH kinase [Acidobacteriota bacterium]
MQAIQTVGIISRPDTERGNQIVPQLLDWLEQRAIRVRYDHVTAAYANRNDGLARQDVPDDCQFVIVLGGDGTLLSAATAIGEREIPLLGVNLGSLGFLTALTADELFPELERALRFEHRIAKRSLLRCTLDRGGRSIASYLALNDVVISKQPDAPMIELETHVGAHLVCTYKADGLIVSTPTGSTAYSLSAGGPIVFPTVAAFCLTPICPHTLTNRPVIIPDDETIRVECRIPDDGAYLNSDGKMGAHLRHGDRVLFKRAAHRLKLIRPPRLLYFDVLRQKLHWGER